MKQSKCPYWDEKEGKCRLEAHIPESQPPNPLQALVDLASKPFHSPSEDSPAYFGEDEDQKKKQEYWEKELEKIDKRKKEK